MAVYIKGMKMPESCRACHLKMNCDDCEGWECVCVPLHQQIGYLRDLLTDKRLDDCPLVPVPPHGRLIDADKIGLTNFEIILCQKGNPFKNALEMLLEKIENAPTVIEAEGGET